MAVPINAVDELSAGSYRFAIIPNGSNHVALDFDYHGRCELTITAYTGQGATTDAVFNSAGLTAEEKSENS